MERLLNGLVKGICCALYAFIGAGLGFIIVFVLVSIAAMIFPPLAPTFRQVLVFAIPFEVAGALLLGFGFIRASSGNGR